MSYDVSTHVLPLFYCTSALIAPLFVFLKVFCMVKIQLHTGFHFHVADFSCLVRRCMFCWISFWISPIADTQFSSGLSTPSPTVKTESNDAVKTWSPSAEEKGRTVRSRLHFSSVVSACLYVGLCHVAELSYLFHSAIWKRRSHSFLLIYELWLSVFLVFAICC